MKIPKLPQAPQMPKTKDPNKSTLLAGLILILGAFGCILIVFYFLINAQRQRMEEMETLEDKLVALDLDKNSIQSRVDQLQDEVGRSIDLNKLVDTAADRYGEEERDRKEGYLWIDRANSISIVTLGI